MKRDVYPRLLSAMARLMRQGGHSLPCRSGECRCGWSSALANARSLMGLQEWSTIVSVFKQENGS